MKIIASLAIALLLSCASATDVIDQQHLGCDPGQDISIMAGVDAPGLHMDGTRDQFDAIVEISNNSHEEVTVKTIRVEQVANDSSPYLVETGYGKYDQVIPAGKDHTFKVQLRGRAAQNATRALRSQPGLEIAVNVALTNGDSYLCRFDVASSR